VRGSGTIGQQVLVEARKEPTNDYLAAGKEGVGVVRLGDATAVFWLTRKVIALDDRDPSNVVSEYAGGKQASD
jgi:hypothetical protein